MNRFKRSPKASVNCRDVHRLLFDYARGALQPTVARRLEAHLGDCPPCLDFVETYNKTIVATRRYCRADATLPPELERKLRTFVAHEF